MAIFEGLDWLSSNSVISLNEDFFFLVPVSEFAFVALIWDEDYNHINLYFVES